MSAIPPPKSLAELIRYATSENSVIPYITAEPSGSANITMPFEGFSPLSFAIAQGYKQAVSEIIKKFTSEQQFLSSFIANDESPQGTQEILSGFFVQLLDFELSNCPEFIKNLVNDFYDCKITALLVGAVGLSKFHNIPWTMEGFHDFKKINGILLSLLFSNNQNIKTNLQHQIDQETDIIRNDIHILVKSWDETIVLMNNLQSNIKITGNIIPVLVGTISKTCEDNSVLHAEGFVWLKSINSKEESNYLFVERSKPDRPGILIYKASIRFDENKFTHFLQKAQASAQGGLKTAISFEDYTENTTASGFFTEIGYINMPMQNEGNCTIASSEGIFLATLYAFLKEKGMDVDLAEKLSKKYTRLIFDANKTIQIIKLRQRATNTQNGNLLAFLQQIDDLNTQVSASGSQVEKLRSREKTKDAIESEMQIQAISNLQENHHFGTVGKTKTLTKFENQEQTSASSSSSHTHRKSEFPPSMTEYLIPPATPQSEIKKNSIRNWCNLLWNRCKRKKIGAIGRKDPDDFPPSSSSNP